MTESETGELMSRTYCEELIAGNLLRGTCGRELTAGDPIG